MKGSKRYRWLKDGIKTSRKWYKHTWNRKSRYNNNLANGSFYKKLAKCTMWEGVL